MESGYGSSDGTFWGSRSLEVEDVDVSGVEFILTHADAVQVPIEIASEVPKPAARVCPDADRACGFWFLQAVKLQPNGYAEAGPESTMSGASQGTVHTVANL